MRSERRIDEYVAGKLEESDKRKQRVEQEAQEGEMEKPQDGQEARGSGQVTGGSSSSTLVRGVRRTWNQAPGCRTKLLSVSG